MIKYTALLLIAAVMVFSITISDSYATNHSVNMVNVTNPANTAPIAAAISVDVPAVAAQVTLFLNNSISDNESSYDELEIILRISNETLVRLDILPVENAFNNDFNIFNVTGNAIELRPTTDGHIETFVLNYTVTDPQGLSTNSTITVNLVAPPVTSTPLNPPPDNHAFNATVNTVFNQTLEHGTHLGFLNLNEHGNFPMSQNRAVQGSLVISVPSLGSAGGNATFTRTSFDDQTLIYTPADDFVGIETFEYFVTATGKNDNTRTGNATLTFDVMPVVVPELCASTTTANLDFGKVAVNATSPTGTVTVTNTGNIPVQTSVAGEGWIADDDNRAVMDVGQTRYSNIQTQNYAQRTALSTDTVTVGDKINDFNDTLDVYLQLSIVLLDAESSFRGVATQTMTFTNTCSN